MSSIANKLRQTTAEGAKEAKEAVEVVDFKMVTFSLAGKDYGIDIMKVREIARIVNFTYVPNTPGFVRGVYNLRGEIISIIDLRAMFNLPFQPKGSDEEESGLILRLDTTLIGVIVDKIDKVIGISSKAIQPPHPIFGDINIKFISGVVENDGRLYIILDADRVLGKPESTEGEVPLATRLPIPSAAPVALQAPAAGQGPKPPAENDTDQERTFVRESLAALVSFTVSEINQAWFDRRFDSWKVERQASGPQIKTAVEAQDFLAQFGSPMSGQLWSEEYLTAFASLLPAKASTHVNVWNPGCARGFETYSLAILLAQKYPESRIKIWASDKDLIAISSAPNLVFNARDVPALYQPFMTEGKNGLSFAPKIKEMILFEYHDMVNDHTLPDLDLVCCRDVLSFLPAQQQQSIVQDLAHMVKPGGLVVLGQGEVLPPGDHWTIKKTELMSVAVHA